MTPDALLRRARKLIPWPWRGVKLDRNASARELAGDLGRLEASARRPGAYLDLERAVAEEREDTYRRRTIEEALGAGMFTSYPPGWLQLRETLVELLLPVVKAAERRGSGRCWRSTMGVKEAPRVCRADGTWARCED